MKRFTSDSPPPSYYEKPEPKYFWCDHCNKETNDHSYTQNVCFTCDEKLFYEEDSEEWKNG